MANCAISIEGIDCIGKETISSFLQEKLEKLGYRVCLLHNPSYDSPVGDIISMILRRIGVYGKIYDPFTLDPYALGSLFMADRKLRDSLIEEELNRADVIVYDRGWFSNVIHQGIKYFLPKDRKELRPDERFLEYVRWCYIGDHSAEPFDYEEICLLYSDKPIEVTHENPDEYEANTAYQRSLKGFVETYIPGNQKLAELLRELAAKEEDPEWMNRLRIIPYRVNYISSEDPDARQKIRQAADSLASEIAERFDKNCREIG